MSDRPQGKIYLVGGGPGDPGLLTLRGQECLERAEVVLYDYLVNPRVLKHAPQAQLVCLGKHGSDRVLDQAEINLRLVELARAGRVVVRLKGGDPAVFGHLAEEVEALRAANVDYEIVPGVTAASAAASYAGIPLTWRDAASAVAFVTGQEGHDKQSQLDYAALARFPGTLVFYMGVTTVQHWTAGLIAAGMPPDTPAACVLRASWPDQQTLLSTLGQMAGRIGQQRVRPPAIFIVGPVAGLSGTIDWFSRRPLAGVAVLATRPVRPADLLADPLAEQLAELGANILRQPAIEIGAPADWQPVDAAIAALARSIGSCFPAPTASMRLSSGCSPAAATCVRWEQSGWRPSGRARPVLWHATTCRRTLCPASTAPRRWRQPWPRTLAAAGFCWFAPAAVVRFWPTNCARRGRRSRR